MSRFEEVVNEAIGEVVLSESPFRAETLAQHIAELVRARQGAARAEVTIAARYPEHKPAPVSGVPHAGDLHAARPRGRLRARHPAHRRRLGDRHDRVPVRAGARRRARARAPAPQGEFTEEQIERCSRSVPIATHNQRGLATLADRLHRGVRRGDRRDDAARDRRGEHVLGDLRADEALGRGRGRRKGAPPPALRRGLRARDDRGRRARPSRSSTARASSPRARRTWRRSTSTTSWPNATGCSPSCARRSPRARRRRARRASRSWLDAAGGAAAGAASAARR